MLRGAKNRYGNAFVKKETDLTSELKAQRLADGAKARYWKVKNTAVKNKMTGASCRCCFHVQQDIFLNAYKHQCLQPPNDPESHRGGALRDN